MADPKLAGRVTAVMKKINLEDQSEARGYRTILISQQRQCLSNISFNKNVNFDTIVNAPVVFTPAADRLSGVLDVAAFDPFSLLNQKVEFLEKRIHIL